VNYQIRTWDRNAESYTPQTGVPRVTTLAGLRPALRRLRELGFNTRREYAPDVLIERIDHAA